MRAAFLSAAARLRRFEEPEVGQQSLFSQETTNIAMPTDWTFARASDDYAVAYDGTVVNVSSNQPAVHGGRWTGSAWSRVDGSGNPITPIEDIVAAGPNSHTRPEQYVARSTLNSHYGVLGTRYHLNGFAYEVTTANDLAASPPTSLTTTTSATGTDGSATVTCRGRYAQPSIHIGPARTNVVTNSQVSNTDWNNIGTAMAATINNGVGPDNTQDLTLLSNTGGQSFHSKAFRLSGQTPGTLYTLSVVFRSSTALTAGLQFYNFSGSLSVLIARLTYATGAVDDNTGGGGGTFTAFGVNPLANSCYQVWMHVTVPAGCSVFDVRVIPNRDNTVAASWVGWANAMVGHVDPRLCLIKTAGSAKTVAAAEMRLPNAALVNSGGAALMDMTFAQRTTAVQQQIIAASAGQDVLGTQSTGKFRCIDSLRTLAGHQTPAYSARRRMYSRWQTGQLEVGGNGELSRTWDAYGGSWTKTHGHVKVRADAHLLVHDVTLFDAGQTRDEMIEFTQPNSGPPVVYEWVDDWYRGARAGPEPGTIIDPSPWGFPRIASIETKNLANPFSSLHLMIMNRFITTKGSSLSTFNTMNNQVALEDRPHRIWGYTVQEYQAYNTPAGSRYGGPMFDGTGPSTDLVGGLGIVYAGHWLYENGSSTTTSINASATSVNVQSSTPFHVGQWVCISNGTSNFTNAEHCQVTGITTGGGVNTLTLGSRGHKSTAVSHGVGSYIRHHALGQTGSNFGWIYNISMLCPLDGNGLRYNQAALNMLDHQIYYGNNNIQFPQVPIVGLHGDVDQAFMGDGGDAAIDVNNDGVSDAGIVGGVNSWREGMDFWYEGVKAKYPGWIMMAGSRQSLVDANFGAQLEHAADGSFLQWNPNYTASFFKWLVWLMHFSAHRKYGPDMTNVLMKTPTRSFPVTVNQDWTGTATDDEDARFTMAVAATEGVFWSPENQDGSPEEWYAPTSADRVTGVVPARNTTDDSLFRSKRGWLGTHVRRGGTQRWRVIDPTVFKPSQAVMGTAFNNTTGWSGVGCTISNPTVSGVGLVLRGVPTSFQNSVAGSRINGPDFSLSAGQMYTCMYRCRTLGSQARVMSVECGSVNELVPVATVWDVQVMSWQQSGAQTDSLDFKIGRDISGFEVDWAYVFQANAGAIRADFEYGIVVYNGSPVTQVIDLGGEFMRLTSDQDPPRYNGATLTQVTLAGFAGEFLLRMG